MGIRELQVWTGPQILPTLTVFLTPKEAGKRALGHQPVLPRLLRATIFTQTLSRTQVACSTQLTLHMGLCILSEKS